MSNHFGGGSLWKRRVATNDPSHEAQSKPGIKMVYPEPRKLKRRISLTLQLPVFFYCDPNGAFSLWFRFKTGNLEKDTSQTSSHGAVQVGPTALGHIYICESNRIQMSSL